MNHTELDRRLHLADVCGAGGPVDGGSAAAAGSTDPLGLSISHIGPHVFGRPYHGYWKDGYRQRLKENRRRICGEHGHAAERRRLDRASVHYFENAELIKLKVNGSPAVGGGIRGKVKAFSAASRRRMLEDLQSIDRSVVELPIFVTLTYPGIYPADACEWKRHLKVFMKRLRRRYPGGWGHWKLEPQKRGAPHFHLLLFGVKRISKNWLSRAWFEVVGSKDHRHLNAGTRVESVRSWRGVICYASKYLGKSIDWLPKHWRDGVGRWWGKFNMKAAGEYCKRRVGRLHWRAWLQLRRVLYRRLKKTGMRLRLQTRAGCTFYLPGNWMPQLIAWARGAPGVPRAAPGAAVDFVMDGVAPF